jgi:hypothetical protein
MQPPSLQTSICVLLVPADFASEFQPGGARGYCGISTPRISSNQPLIGPVLAEISHTKDSNMDFFSMGYFEMSVEL